MPNKLADFAKHKDAEAFVEYNGMECVNCGSCSFSCPAKRSLAGEINAMRQQILADRKKK
jgi:electron transport complex protein RnfC